MSLFRQMMESLNTGDPFVRTWFLISSDYAPFGLSATYLLMMTWILPALMKRRKPLELRHLMAVYNLSLVLAYVFIVIYFIYISVTTDMLVYICKDGMLLSGVRTGHVYNLVTSFWFFYILKFVEFADTAFFVLRKKDHLVTKLHMMHHALLPLIIFVILRTETNGFYAPILLMNSLVHIIMYTYYGLAALGPSVQKFLWWKKYLTIIQITQFVVMLTYLVVMGPLIGCRTSTHSFALMGGFLFVLVFLFYNYYSKTYAAATGEGKTKSGTTKYRPNAGKKAR